MALQPNQMSVHEILEMIFQNKWRFLLSTFLGLAIAVFSLRMSDKWYRSEAEILIDDRQSSDPMISGLGVSQSVHQRFNQVRELVMSQDHLNGLLEEMGVAPKVPQKREDGTPVAPEEWANMVEAARVGCIRGIQATTVIGLRGGIITIRSERTGQTPREGAEEAQRVVSVLVKEFQSKFMDSREQQIESAKKTLQSLLYDYDQKLNSAEMMLKDFQEINQVDLSETSAPQDLMEDVSAIHAGTSSPKAQVNQLMGLVTRQTSNDIELSSLRARRDTLRKQIDQEPDFIISETTTEQSTVARRLDEELALARSALAKLRLNRSDQHPMVKEKLAEVARLEREVANYVAPVVREQKRASNELLNKLRMDLTEIETEISALESEQDTLTRDISILTEKIRAIPTKELEKARLNRELGIQSQIYRNIRMRYENAILTEQLDKADKEAKFYLTKPATLNQHAVRPNSKFIVAMGTFAGMVIGVVLCFLREFADTSFRNLEDASRFLDMPVLGVIPVVEKTSRRRRRRMGERPPSTRQAPSTA